MCSENRGAMMGHAGRLASDRAEFNSLALHHLLQVINV